MFFGFGAIGVVGCRRGRRRYLGLGQVGFWVHLKSLRLG